MIARIAPLLLLVSLAHGQTPLELPEPLREVGIDQRLDQPLPLDAVFRDHTGRNVRLGEYFTTGRPVIVSLVYYRCPMLCTVVLNELLRAMRGLPLDAGKDYDVLTISFDPRETPELAAEKRARYLKQYGRGSAQSGWHFLTGDEDSIRQITQAVGFRYRYDAKFDQYVHASGLVIVTPQGRIARYFFGVEYSPKDLRLSLVEASQNRAGSLVDQVLLYCFHYDPATGRYSLAVMNTIRVGAILTMLALGGFVYAMFRRERRTRRRLIGTHDSGTLSC